MKYHAHEIEYGLELGQLSTWEKLCKLLFLEAISKLHTNQNVKLIYNLSSSLMRGKMDC